MPKRLLKNWAISFYVAFVLILATAISGTAIGSFASGCTVTATNSCTNIQVTVKGGSLSESVPGGVTVNPVTLNGKTAPTTTYTLPITVIDATGSGNGWNLTITSTPFSAGYQGGPPRLGNKASSVTGVMTSCSASDICTANTIKYSPNAVPVPAGVTAPGANPFFSTPVNTGMGIFLVTATVTVTVPAFAFSGLYSSTVTVTLVSGP